MKFDKYEIASEIKANLKQLGWKRPTDIQYKSIPPVLKGEDVLAIAQTGTGKTAAFAIPVIHLLHDRKSSKRVEGIKCLVMAPTRELAMQLTEVFEQVGKHTRVKTFCVFGGVEQDPQIARLQIGIDILIATPGRMFDLVSQGYIDLSRLEILILDEADHMLDKGFIKDIRDMMRFLPKRRQTLFYSATIDKEIKKLAYSLVRSKAIRIQISPKNPVAKNVNHSVAFIEMDDKRFFLERLIQENEEYKILVFVRTKVRAERVVKAMQRVEVEARSIHGDKEQKDRLQVMNAFKKDEFKVMIATDVSARGIDIPSVDCVVNYDLPEQTENYVHRVGRTGRGRLKGEAISFCSADEKALLEKIEEYLGQPIQVLEIKSSAYQQTILHSQDTSSSSIKELMDEIENFDKNKSKKRKNRKKK